MKTSRIDRYLFSCHCIRLMITYCDTRRVATALCSFSAMTASSISDGLPSLSPAPSDATEESPARPPELASAKGGGEPTALSTVFNERVDQDVRYVSIISSSEMQKLIKGVGMCSLIYAYNLTFPFVVVRRELLQQPFIFDKRCLA